MAMLALEATTEVCSVAAWHNGEIVVEQFDDSSLPGGNLLLSMAAEVLRESQFTWADINHLAFSHGPGSFTGVRVATGLIQGLALGRDIPVVGVSTLATLASEYFRRPEISGSYEQKQVLCAQDARMGEIYWGIYSQGEDGVIRPIQADQLSPAGEVSLGRSSVWAAVGTASQYANEIAMANRQTAIEWHEEIWPKASNVARLAADMLATGQVYNAVDVRPVYLRNEVTHSAR